MKFSINNLNAKTSADPSVNLNEISIVTFPNPFADKISVVAENISDRATLQEISLTGQIVFESKMQNQNLEINTTKFAQGIYHVIIRDDNNILSKKIIKQ